MNAHETMWAARAAWLRTSDQLTFDDLVGGPTADAPPLIASPRFRTGGHLTGSAPHQNHKTQPSPPAHLS